MSEIVRHEGMSSLERQPEQLSPEKTPGAVWIWLLGLFAVISLLAVARHRFFLSGTLDMGFYVHDVWLAGHAEWHNTLLDIHLFQDHLSPVLFVLAPLAHLPTAEALLVVQSAGLAAGVLPAFHLGLHHRDARLGHLAVVWYALSVGVWYGALYDFHPVALAVPFLLWLMLVVDRGGPTWMVMLCLVMLVLIREDAAVLGALVAWRGAWIERSAAKWIAGLGAFAVGVTYVALGPELFGDSGYFFWLRYADYGLGPTEVLSRLPENLLLAVGRLFRVDPLITLTGLFAPFLVVAPIAGWRRSWPGLLLLGSNLVSGYGPVTTLYFQYSLLVVPFLLWGATAVWTRVEMRRPTASRAAVVATVAIFLLLGPVWYRGYGTPDRFADQILTASSRNDMAEVLSTIPAEASVSAADAMLPHLAERAEIFPFPGPMVCPNTIGFYIAQTRVVDHVVVGTEAGSAWRAHLIEWGFALVSTENGVQVWSHTGSIPTTQRCPSRGALFAEEIARLNPGPSESEIGGGASES